MVAVVWQWLFARTFELPVHAGNSAALFLTAWFIYLGDRFAEASSLTSGAPRSLRQQFCLRHREIWIAALLIIGGLDAYVIWQSAAAETFFVGAIVGLLALTYLLLNHPLGRIWRLVPLKEIAIGFLFAAGTLVALLPMFPLINSAFVLAVLAFAFLCTLNCISIACWERELDEAQRKTSIATRHLGITRHVAKICALLGFGSFAMAITCPVAAPLLGSISVSALLLMWLNASAGRGEWGVLVRIASNASGCRSRLPRRERMHVALGAKTHSRRTARAGRQTKLSPSRHHGVASAGAPLRSDRNAFRSGLFSCISQESRRAN